MRIAQEQRQESRGRSYSKDAYRYERRHSPVRRSYSTSRSPPPRHSPVRKRSPISRRTSPGRGRSPRRSSPIRSPQRYNRARYSRSRSPPPLSSRTPFPAQPTFQPSGYPSYQQPTYNSSHNRNNNRGDFGNEMKPPPENKYLGLGNASDEFDSFRRNKSQAYNRREPHQPMTCYKCNKVIVFL